MQLPALVRRVMCFGLILMTIGVGLWGRSEDHTVYLGPSLSHEVGIKHPALLVVPSVANIHLLPRENLSMTSKVRAKHWLVPLRLNELSETNGVHQENPSLSVGRGTGNRTVPFYIYDKQDLGFEWNESCGTTAYSLAHHRLFKHGNGLHFLEQAYAHPWRTRNADNALLFVIPALLGFAARDGQCGGSSAWNRVGAVASAIKKLPYFGRNGGRDHIVLTTEYRVYMTKWQLVYTARFSGARFFEFCCSSATN